MGILPSETAFVSASFAFPITSDRLLAPEGKRVSADKLLWAKLIAWQTVIAAQMYQGLGGFN